MTIASAIVNKQQQVAACYTAISNKGGTLPATQDVANMPTAINSISGLIGETRTEQLDSTSGNTYTPSTGYNGITSITVTPKNYNRTVTAQTVPSTWAVPSGYSGHGNISVNAVTASIDANITAGNIKSGVSILGVSGNVVELNGETKTVSLTGFGQTFTPSSGKNAITSITVNPSNLARTVNPSTTTQSIGVQSGFSGNGTITVNPVTASIDANIQAGNIKSGVTILGVTGTYGGGSAGIPREVKNGVYQMPTENFTFSFPSTATAIGAYALCYAFYGSTGLTGSVDLSNVTSVAAYGLQAAFNSCTGITGSIDLSSVTSINSYALQYAFRGCTGITGVDLSNVTSVAAYGLESAFNSCTGLTGSIDLSSVTSIAYRGSYQIFQKCTGITSVDLSSVISIASSGFQYAFYDCKKLQTIIFNSLKTTSFGGVDAFSSMFSTTTGSEATGGCTVHFPSNLQSTISGLTGYPTFGGSSSYIHLAFDLPATS